VRRTLLMTRSKAPNVGDQTVLERNPQKGTLVLVYAAKEGNPMNKSTTENARQKIDQLIENVGQVGHLSALKRILAPTDLSLDSRKSVRYAIALAEHSMLK
jgi:hypothetical protein